MKSVMRLAAIALLAAVLSGCFLTKLATTPMRLVGAAGSVVGAVLSIIPVAGNAADEALEKVDGAIDNTADSIDKIPL
ncbi:MAG: hypothetical protein AOY29_00345 [Alcanivorax borkumensis]|jgi:ABC-type uncharacterized transport system auxiliary subunit|uniref:Lipoprotein n=1 Tax=Alcanivorax borkumensis (strain ATCC 700651 / DSM 11573 / NCIMB 13689 / SK2) TaxID=393595 RepID=Q0VRH0_ALCBS|nr:MULTISPECIES: DUF6726 family protein [Alcanivorax]OJH08537.1 MAG: hypothetical protein AOY29_00345 [Alcanivorax borkumensis]EUC69765.1 hypothetical protein Y017_12680 [Alcanivorax sp. 97CO-5]PKG01605.1 hypothetical protein Y019_07555 [Alcanivorax sp. 97CO-6]CAL16228.1 hypothetical protein predicted by Glimmer/Critica [Alcanivorax borkumensis SK2]BAP13678.1 hypothetical protein AS19_08270 [Alcanivorax sp. NBRC 101098]